MKRVFTKLAFGVWSLSVALVLSTGCSPNFDANSDSSYSVRIPIDDGANHYHLQTVTLRSVTDLSAMTGTIAHIKTGGSIEITADSSGQGMLHMRNIGSTPTAHFIKSDGVYIPSDYQTAVMAATLYQFEQIKNFFDDGGANEGLQFPRTVLVDVSLTVRSDTMIRQTSDNAVYLSGIDLFLLLPYSSDQVPMAMNGGLLAHEYTHSVFEQKLEERDTGLNHAHGVRAFLEVSRARDFQYAPVSTAPYMSTNYNLAPLSDDERETANRYLLSSFNEGVADFFGYLYSRNVNFSQASVDDANTRNLSLAKQSIIPSSVEEQTQFLKTNHLLDNSGSFVAQLDPHNVGANFAHLLYAIEQSWGTAEAKRTALKFLDAYATLFERDYKTRFIPMSEILNLVFVGHPATGAVCRAFAETYPNEYREKSVTCVSE